MTHRASLFNLELSKNSREAILLPLYYADDRAVVNSTLNCFPSYVYSIGWRDLNKLFNKPQGCSGTSLYRGFKCK